MVQVTQTGNEKQKRTARRSGIGNVAWKDI
jgi:hypothetical protein